MDRKKLFKISAYLVIFIFIINFIANKLYWYYSIWWFDMPMHFLGGLFIGLGCLWFLYSKDRPHELSWRLVLKIFLGVLLVGVLWEIFEIIFYQIIAQSPFNSLDTIHDIFFDLAGGLFSLLFFFKRIMFSSRNEVK